MPQPVKLVARSRLRGFRAPKGFRAADISRPFARTQSHAFLRFLKNGLILLALISLTACNLTKSSSSVSFKSATVKPAPPKVSAAPAPAPVVNINLAKVAAVAEVASPAPEIPAAPAGEEFITPAEMVVGEEMSLGLIDLAMCTTGLHGELFTARAGQDFLRDNGLTSDFVLTGALLPPPPMLEAVAVAAPAPSAGTPETAVIVNTLNTAPRAAKKATAGHTESLLMAAYGQTGRHYTSGGQVPESGFDDSGFTRWVYAQNGFSLPRNAQKQISGGREVARGELRPGDLLAYLLPGGAAGGYHVGIYTGHGNFLHADAASGVVTETAAFGPQYAPYFLGGRRYYDDPAAGPLSESQKMSATSSAVKLALAELGPDDVVERSTKKPAKKSAAKKRKSSKRRGG